MCVHQQLARAVGWRDGSGVRGVPRGSVRLSRHSLGSACQRRDRRLRGGRRRGRRLGNGGRRRGRLSGWGLRGCRSPAADQAGKQCEPSLQPTGKIIDSPRFDDSLTCCLEWEIGFRRKGAECGRSPRLTGLGAERKGCGGRWWGHEQPAAPHERTYWRISSLGPKCRSFLRARSSIWRTRSRVTCRRQPTSSSVRA